MDAEYFATIPVRTIRERVLPLSDSKHAWLVAKLQRPLLNRNIKAAARLAAVCAFTHPAYGTLARAAFCEAMDAWKRVYISVAISPDGLGFAVGNEAVASGLYDKLERGEHGGGTEGA